jgi:leucyl aminopeptidase
MPSFTTARPGMRLVPITPLAKAELARWLKRRPAAEAAWVKAAGFEAEPGSLCLVPGAGGALARVLAGIDPDDELWSYAGLPGRLPASAPGGRYALDGVLDPEAATRAALGWALGSYAFTRYRKSRRRFATLAWPKGVDKGAVQRAMEATYLVRDLINTPAGDMGPAELAEAAAKLAQRHQAKVSVTTGAALLKKNYPAIHAVGRASSRAPRLIDLRWGAKGPRVTLVGKGVCFDSGGLDLKSAAGMKLMKKDMGGAAHALGLASMIMAARLSLRLRVLVPAVENSVSGDAFRPLDVLQTRKGLSVEVGNTDAEGRLVLCDALAEADREDPDLIVDFATLTGAAPDRRRTGRAGRRAAGHVLQRRWDRRGAAGPGPGGARPGLAPAAAQALPAPARQPGRGPQQHLERTPRRRDHGGAVPGRVRPARDALGAFRRHGLEPGEPARPARGRRGHGPARHLRPDRGTGAHGRQIAQEGLIQLKRGARNRDIGRKQGSVRNLAIRRWRCQSPVA